MAIFTDGFESGDFSAWDGTGAEPGCSIVVEAVNPHHGTKNAKCIVDGASENAYAYKGFAGADDIAYARGYFKFDDLPDADGDKIQLIEIRRSDRFWEYAIQGCIKHTGGSVKFVLTCWEAGVLSTVASDLEAVTGTWYCVEIKRDITNDLQELWVDGVSEATNNQVQSENNGSILVGLTWKTYGGTDTLYCDCFSVDSAYIGPEAAGGPTVKKGSNLASTMTEMLNSKMLFSIANRFPKLSPRRF